MDVRFDEKAEWEWIIEEWTESASDGREKATDRRLKFRDDWAVPVHQSSCIDALPCVIGESQVLAEGPSSVDVADVANGSTAASTASEGGVSGRLPTSPSSNSDKDTASVAQMSRKRTAL